MTGEAGSLEAGPGAPLARAVLRSGTKFAGLNLAALGASMVAGLVAARVLGPERLGIWNTATIVLAYLPFLTFGVDHAAAQELPLHRGAGRHADAEQVKALYFTFAMPVATVVALLVAGISLAARMSALLRGSLLTVAVLGLLSSFVRWAVILLRSEHRFGAAGLVDGMRSYALLLAVPLVVRFGLHGLWVSNLLGGVASAALGWRLVRRLPRPQWDTATLRRLMAFGLPITAVALIQILSVTGDRMLVLGFLGTAALGLYGLGRTLTLVLMVSGGIIGPVVYPRMTERLGRTGEVRSLLPLVVVPTQILGAVLPFVLVPAWFALPVLIGWLLPSFQMGIRAAQLLAAATAAYLLCGTADYLLVSARRQVMSLVLFAGGVVVGLAAEFLALAAGFGLVGVAAGAGLGNLAYAATVVFVAQRLCDVPAAQATRTVVRSMAPLLVAIALCAAVERWWPVAGLGLAGAGGAALRTGLVALACVPVTLRLDGSALLSWRQALRS